MARSKRMNDITEMTLNNLNEAIKNLKQENEKLKLEGKRLCRRILAQSEYVTTAKIELDNITSGNYIHKVGSTQWKLSCISKTLKVHVKTYKEKALKSIDDVLGKVVK